MKPYYHDERAGITIYHGDCRNVLPELSRVDLVLADPPYNVGLEYSSYNDNDPAYGDWCNNIFNLIATTSNRAAITPGIGNVHRWPAPKWMLAWWKSNGVTRTPLTVGQKISLCTWEPILWYGNSPENPPVHDSISIPISVQREADGHPCPKPLNLFIWLVNMGTAAGQIVVDPFMGSGTTLRAAKDLGRRAIGIEIEEKYCEIAVRRLAQEVLFT